MSEIYPSPSSYVERKPAGMPCFAKALILVVVLGALMIGASLALGVWVKHAFPDFISEHRVPVHTNGTTDAQYHAALAKLQSLSVTEVSHRNAAPVVLNADDLNALVAHDPNLSAMRDQCYFTVEGDELGLEVSTGFLQRELPRWQQYYLNLRLHCELEVAGGAIRIKLRRVESLRGEAVPAWTLNGDVFRGMMDGINQAVNRSIRDDPALARVVDAVGSVKILNGEILITPKASPGSHPPGGSPVAGSPAGR